MKEFNDWFKSQYGSSDILIQGMVKEIAKESWMAASGGKREDKYKDLVHRVITILENNNMASNAGEISFSSLDHIISSVKQVVNNIEGMKP